MKKILFIGLVWPEPQSSAAGSRTLQLIEVFQNQEYDITFASTANTSANTFDLSSMHVGTKAIQLNDASFDIFIKKLQPEIVIFDRFMIEEQFGWRVAEHCPKAIRILDTIDLHFLRKAREMAYKKGDFDYKSQFLNDYAKREIASIYRCDLSLIISEFEMVLLKTQFKIPKSLLFYVPFLLQSISNLQIEKLPNFKNRQHFVTIGNFMHPPNFASVLHLKQVIWPVLSQKNPHAELHIYGSYAKEKVNQLHNQKERFFIKGFAKNVNEVMRNAKLCLAPLPFGAGLKGKLVDAMLNGTPSIMSPVAAEGMFENQIPGFIEDESEKFIDQAELLYQEEGLWNEKSKLGFEVISKRFNKDSHSKKLIQAIENLCQNLSTHRAENFIGQMLQHHTLKSSKYLSKWIEEKNKS